MLSVKLPQIDHPWPNLEEKKMERKSPLDDHRNDRMFTYIGEKCF